MIDRLKRALARSRLGAGIALKVRNQAEMVVGYHLGQDHRPEANGEAELLTLVRSSMQTFMDVGANVGEWTHLFAGADKSKTGILIEPSRTAISRLRQRFADYGNLRFVHAAASDAPGEATFYEQANAGELSSLVPGTPEATPRQIQTTTADIEFSRAGWKSLDFLKIDAEGYDLHVLRGAKTMLAEQRVGLIQFEYNKSWMYAGSTLFSAISLLESYGYKVNLLRTTGLHPFNYGKYGEFYSYSNFVAVAPEKLPLLGRLIRGAF